MNDFFDNYEYLENMYDIFDWIDNNTVRVSKRYVGDAENSFEMYTDVQFFCRFRFLKEIVLNVIMDMIYEDREEFIHTDNRGLPVERLFKVLIALRFYASGNYQGVNGDILGLSQSSVSRVIREISKLIASTTNIKKWIKLPTIQEPQEIKQQFYGVAKFPGVIGAIDCTHIPIKSLGGGDNAEIYRNRKGWMSINTQIGSTHDI
ncbi:LOW QUALITY PROTEIN: putative nuclease HARBI1 [Rhopalosiphum padi]|uniref:LOW QUALITY PROTEIN: putative nuclease HARBI1 n=1 Tax=Rhopalosiphum padi TaxID=40932 RepID=UPI00298E2343|nr:LOW QUALITY PROTEIN: putative nuclease HARBI1 [Rhopalosiphum padi]